MIAAERVEEILRQSLAEGGEPLKGVVREFALDRPTVATHRDEIVRMLEQLPSEFFDNGGGGWSFLNFCTTQDGDLWTGEHAICEALIVLAMALDLARWTLPAELWPDLPGGMPYVTVRRSVFHGAAHA